MHYKKKIIFMVVALLALNSAVFSQGVGMNVKGATIKQAMDQLKKKTGYSFVYSVGDLDTQKAVSISEQDKSIEDIVDKILEGQNLSYEIQGKNIIVKKNNNTSGKAKKLKKVTGVITDEKGLPVPGANVVVEGTNNAVLTDLDGRFSIDVPEDGKLVISYIGFATQTVAVNGKSSLSIKLVQGTKSLDEVVVTGYAAQNKKNITSSVVTKKISENDRLTATTAAGNLLTGRLAGVKVSTPSGIPGSGPNIAIRQSSSWNSQAVLYVIDGVVRDAFSFNTLAPNEIDVITVLKDAAAAAVYGARAAGGVIVVTTRRGDAGKMKIDYSYSYGRDYRTKNMDLTSAVQLGQIYNRASTPADNYYYTPDDLTHLQKINGGWGYDHINDIWNTPTIATHNFGVSGGTEKIKYFAGLSDVKQQSFLASNYYDKTNFRFNTTINVTDDLQFYAGMAITNTDQSTLRLEGPDSLYRKLLVWQPWQPFLTDGGQFTDNGGWISNVAGEIEGQGGYLNFNNFRSEVNLSLNYKIPFVKGLSAKVAYATNRLNVLQNEFAKGFKLAQLPMSNSGHIYDTNDDHIVQYLNTRTVTYPYLYKKNGWTTQKQFNFQMNYDRTFGKHSVQGIFVYEAAETDGASVYGGREKAPVYLTDQFWAFSGARADDWGGGDPSYVNGRKSFVGQANYAYSNKYLASFSFREDGSMNFAPDNRWGFFPAGSLGWVISEEDFFSPAKKIVDRLKLRASAGLTGNDSVGGWQWQESYQQGSTAYFGQGGSPSVGLRYGSIVNENITWEKTLNYNFGIDVDFLKHWNTSIEYWRKDTYDILGPRTASVPTSFSGTMPSENYGEYMAEGWDFSIGYKNKIGNFNYRIDANASRGWNKVIQRDHAANAQYVDISEGKSSSYIVGYSFDKIIRTQSELDAFKTAHPGYTISGVAPQLGMMVYNDISGPNGTPDNIINSWDRIILQNNNEPVYFGLNLGADYKGFTFDATFSGSAGSKKSINDIYAFTYEHNRMSPAWLNDSWTPENPNATYPKYATIYGPDSSLGRSYRDYDSAVKYKNNDFVRLQYLNIGYNFKELGHLKRLSNLKLYVTGNNLFVIGNFNKYWDPEGTSTLYPVMKSYSIGLNIGI